MKLSLSDARDLMVQLASGIGETPLIELWPGTVPNRNRIFAKAECFNPTGSHYDRVYLRLFEIDLPVVYKSMTKTRFIEVSSGNAGASFAWVCGELGVPCEVVIPDGLPKGSLANIKTLNRYAQITVSGYTGEFISGAQKTLRDRIREERENGVTLHCMNHSRRACTLEATERIAEESVRQFSGYPGATNIDYYIAACGNGASLIGPARYLKAYYPNLRVIAFEADEAPVGFCQKSGLSVKPGSCHALLGTGAWGVRFPFIHAPEYGFNDLVDEVRLVSHDALMRACLLRYRLGVNVGRTSLVGLDIALTLADTVNDTNMLIVFYDNGSKYAF